MVCEILRFVQNTLINIVPSQKYEKHEKPTVLGRWWVSWSSLGSGQQTNRREEAGVATLDHARQQNTKYNALRGFLTWPRVAIWSGAGVSSYHCIPTACWGEFVCSKVQEITRYHYLGWGARSGASHLIANGLISGHLWRGDIRYYTTV